LFQLFDAEDNIIISRNTYGGTYRMAMEVLSRQALTFNWVDSRDPANIEAAINPHTKLVYVETPTNPMLEICDIRAVSDICRRKGILLAVDNTFMSPYGQRPLEFGADVVMHSSTKYLGGHSDIIGGALITENRELYEKLHFIQKSTGAVPGPFDAWLILRSTKTLGLRYQQAADNALELARWLAGIKQVQGVIYPGLETHGQHKLAAHQQRTPRGKSIFGSMISIYLETIETRDRFLKKLKIFTFAESLGGVESLVSIPFAMTHGAVPIKEKLALGITETLVRFSIGIEDVEDLMEDIKQALD
ncbi:MAG: aminotransferase class V-fold PLP-dependent enzyme, partial [Candidatus Neomarinimicrobiota bacterium]